MDVLEAIYRRRAIRQYTAEPIGREQLTTLIDAAIQAPSAVDRQPWLFTVIENQDLLDRISQHAKKHILASFRPELASDHFHSHLSDPDFQIFYHAPVLILISAGSDDDWAVEDCSLAAANLMLAACAMDLGTCWIGFAQRWLETALGKATIGLPEGSHPVAPIIVGHPNGIAQPVPRKPPDIRWKR